MFPELAIRELVANALIHQDFSVTGAGPMMEIFDDRIEITNPGEPLVDTQRFLDTPPRSRNASLRERFGIKENNKAVASRRIREAVDAGMIKPFDEDAGPRFMKYVPFWA